MKQDHQFEKSFSELAYSALQNSYPDLLEKSVGFQLVDSNDENTKALGIFAVDMGGSHFYIPVFFVSGKLKPLELMYDRRSDRFVPLERTWVNLISKPQNMDIGQSIKMPRIGISNPNLEPYANPPRTGRVVTSSAQLEESDVDNMLKQAADEESLPITLFLSMAPPLVKKAYLNFLNENPEYTNALLEHYTWDVIKEACLVDPNKYVPIKPKDEFAVLTDPLDKRASVEATKSIINDGYFVLDKRAGMASDAYFTDAIMKFESATDTGVYKIMDSTGDVKNYLVIQNECDEDKNKYDSSYHMNRAADQHSPNRRVCVVDIRDGTFYKSTSAKPVMGQRNHDSRFLMNTIIESLPSSAEMIPGKRYFLIMKKGDSYVSRGPFDITGMTERDGMSQFLARNSKCKSVKILIRPGTKSLGTPRERVITATSDVKVIPVQGEGDWDKFCCQSPKALEACAYDRGINKVELFTDGFEFNVRTIGGSKASLTKKAALETLCLGLSMRSRDALRLVKTAEDEGRASCFIKQAVSPYPVPSMYAGPQYAPQPVAAMSDPQYQAQQYWPEQYYNEQWSPPTPIGPRQGFTARIGPENMAEQPQHMSPTAAIQGAQTGDKKLMDAATISSMATFNDIDDLIDEYLPDLEKALDKLGRMIFMFWYKTDKFADKYTNTQIKETEDTLRNLFKELGKTIHKFKTSKSEVHGMIEGQ
jgi:hypothetical protein